MQENTDQKNSEYGQFLRSEQIRSRLWIRSHLPKKLLAKNFIFLWNVQEGCSLYLLLFVHKRRYVDQKTVFIHQYFIQLNYYEWVWFWKDYWLEFSWHSINFFAVFGSTRYIYFHKNNYIWLTNLISVASCGQLFNNVPKTKS